MDSYDYKRWYLSGHSLGGAMAAAILQMMGNYKEQKRESAEMAYRQITPQAAEMCK